MALIQVNADLSRSASAQERTASALERIAEALERLSPPIPEAPSEPSGAADLHQVNYADSYAIPEDEQWRAYGPRSNY